ETCGLHGQTIAVKAASTRSPWRGALMTLIKTLVPAVLLAALNLTAAMPAQAQQRDRGNQGRSPGADNRSRAVERALPGERAPSGGHGRVDAPRQERVNGDRQSRDVPRTAVPRAIVPQGQRFAG